MRSLHVCLVTIAGWLTLATTIAEANTDSITLDQRIGTDDWEIRYELAEPVSQLVAERSPNDEDSSRRHTWRAASPEFELILKDGEDVIRRKDGKAFDQASFLVTARYANITFDWPTFQPYGDGGLLIFTGRFHACPESCDRGGRMTLTLSKYDGKPLIWDGSESFAFIGDTEVIEYPEFDAILDRTLPDYLRDDLAATFPKLMTYYEAQLDPIPVKPQIFVSHNNDKPGGRSDGADGGTLGGRQLYMHFYGPSWQVKDVDEIFFNALFFAHEIAHLFQRPIHPPKNQAWVREGSADAMAIMAVADTESFDQQAITETIENSLTYCAASIEGGSPLIEHASLGEFRSYYKCGMIMHLAADAAMRRASEGKETLFTLWRGYRDAVEKGAPTDQDTMIDLISEKADEQTTAFIKKIIFDPLDNPEAVLRQGLADAGYQHQPSP